ncbi:BgTH12-02034 [Blumeria graminis f. sp. triticale]|uniref:Ubiquitin-related modifier 1 n=1 Tax=Blumeria graminis f. sp. triticale TaxID=1689686 RepID=A0A9W4GEL6_BLUGR|nr:BgTH12-02034 [Blumeria graminis f. sp. triticale]
MDDHSCSLTLPITVEFMGGLEMLFNNQRTLSISVPAKMPLAAGGQAPTTLGWLIVHLCAEHMTDARKDMFVLDGHVRPGILVLINDADWELEGEGTYTLQANDNILFVSTLHGG